MNRIKLTPKQADVIRRMRQGATLTKWRATVHTYAGCQMQLGDGQILDVNSNVVTSLVNKQLIKPNQFAPYNTPETLMALTPLGRDASIAV